MGCEAERCVGEGRCWTRVREERCGYWFHPPPLLLLIRIDPLTSFAAEPDSTLVCKPLLLLDMGCTLLSICLSNDLIILREGAKSRNAFTQY
jgi:hypothetical protein